MVPTIAWEDDEVVMLDQRRLPGEEVYLRCTDHRQVAAAIKDMAIRGAPAIGVAAALGIALGVARSKAAGAALRTELGAICDDLRATRPTAVNLFWAIDRMRRAVHCPRSRTETMGSGRDSFERPWPSRTKTSRRVGAWATWERSCSRRGRVSSPTATRGPSPRRATEPRSGVIRSAVREGKVARVFADETRPYLQGARLTAWELTPRRHPHDA